VCSSDLDTLFVCGCGRVFETDGRTLWASLRKLASLPEQTRVYPGHDYTEENLRFALTQKPNDAGLLRKLDEIQSAAAKRLPAVPSSLADEKRLNPFLTAGNAEDFTRLRKLKDMF
jgi:hydroxyacylglutathione hydrolase